MKQMYQLGPNFRCLDSISKVSKAKPCEKCGTPVCNVCYFLSFHEVIIGGMPQVCRFHIYRSLERLWGNDPDWRFDDEVFLEENPRPEWRQVGYQYTPLAEDPETTTQNVLADSLRVYCLKHFNAYKNGLRQLLHPVKVRDAPLCTCNPLDGFVGRWLCIPCHETERRLTCNRTRTQCCEDRCKRPADVAWKQCCLCKRLKEPYVGKGFNAMYRHD